MFKKLVIFIFCLLISSLSHGKDILISFDGSGYLDMWKDTIQFAKDNNVKFTYFISAPYFLTWDQEEKNPYWALIDDKRPLLIKFRNNTQKANIQLRFQYVMEAQDVGCEIGSHLVGHYDGRPWTYDQWVKEMSYFNWIMSNGMDVAHRAQITGVRAPFMCTNEDYFRALRMCGFVWDSSVCTLRDKHLVHSGINIDEVPVRRMEFYNDQEQDMDKSCSPFDCDWVAGIQWVLFPKTKNETSNDYDTNAALVMEDSYFNTMRHDYLSDDPRPTQICLHFQKRPGEPYYQAMIDFVQWVKDKNPRFLTYSEYLQENK
jgi:hypothetical protein